MRSRALLAALVFGVLACAVAWAWSSSGRQVSDVGLYRSYGESMARGVIPYRDFDVEYPPGALPVFTLPALITGDARDYAVAFAAMLALVGGIGVLLCDSTLAALGRSLRERDRILAALALSPLLLGALLLDRFDLVPAVLTTAALLALLLDRPRIAGLVLGAAIAVKLYPLVILPVALSWVVRRHGRREGAWVAALAVAVPAVVYLPFLLGAPDGVARSIGHQLGRPLQIESLGSGVLLAAHHLSGMTLEWSSGHGSQNLNGSAADAVALASSVAQLAALGAVWWLSARRPLSAEQLVRYSSAAVVAFIAFGKVLSPQYLIWLLFLVPLVGGLRGRLAGGLFALAALLTLCWFPARYWGLPSTFDPVSSWCVLARDLTLVGLFAVLVVTLGARERNANRLDR